VPTCNSAEFEARSSQFENNIYLNKLNNIVNSNRMISAYRAVGILIII